MNILVTGGAGFIGSNLCDELLRQNNTVIVADKLLYGTSNINHLLTNPKFILKQVDLNNAIEVERLFDEYSFDIVYHLSANSDIQRGGNNPNIDFQDTFLSTKNILDSMRKYKIKRLAFASSSAIYGNKSEELLREDTGELCPVSYYGAAKLASEAFISSYAAMCDMRVVIFRFSNVVGNRLTHGVIFDFINKLKNDPNKLEILGDGKQKKEYIYVNDLIEAIIPITNKNEKVIDIYNVSSIGEGAAVTDIADIIIGEMDLSDVNISYTGGNCGWNGDVSSFEYSIEKILKTGWNPRMSSREAIIKSVKENLMCEK